MENTTHEVSNLSAPPLPLPPGLAPVLMVVFWMLLGGFSRIKVMESIWRFPRRTESGICHRGTGRRRGVGALLAGALLGLIKDPRLLVLLMAVFAGRLRRWGCAGQLPWEKSGKSVAKSPAA